MGFTRWYVVEVLEYIHIYIYMYSYGGTRQQGGGGRTIDTYKRRTGTALTRSALQYSTGNKVLYHIQY
jgi:hypothetical protein